MDRIIYNIASYNRKESLLKTIESIYNFADIINISLNLYPEIPHQLIDSKINIILTDNTKGDAYKFYNLVNSDGYFFTIDDDIIYPPNYTDYLIQKVEKYNRKKVVTLHGRFFNNFPIASYYHSWKNFYHCMDTLNEDSIVQIGGTGVMCFHTNLLKVDIDYFKKPNMADVWIGKYCYENNIGIICVEHNKNFLKLQEVGETIYETYKKSDDIQTKIVNQTFTNQKKQVSIIVPTYKNTEYIINCVNSIIISCDIDKFEILVGIDGCEETLNFIKKNNFNQNVKFHYFEKNVGPYIIKNSLAKIANSDILLFFDSDDIMKENMISEILEKMKNNDFVKPMYSDFTNIPNYNITKSNTYGEGVFSITKELFISMNGFEPWPIAADSDFMTRLYKNNKKFTYTSEVVFYRRIHPDSLTQRKETNYSSILRSELHKKSKSKTYFGPLEKLHTESFIGITTNDIFIGTNEGLLNINRRDNSELLNSILSQTKRQKPIIDYDKINEVLNKKTNIESPKVETKQNKPNERKEIIQLKKDSIIATNRKLLPSKPNRRNDLPNIFSKKR